MPFLKVNYHDPADGFDALTGFNNVSTPASTGVIIADLLDVNGNATGYTLTHSSAFGGASGAALWATSSPDADFPLDWWRSAFNVDVGNNVQISGLPVGADYTLKIAGNNGNSRSTEYAVTNAGVTPQTYTDAGALDPVEAPVTFTGTVPGDGILTITIAELNIFAYVNGFSLDVVESGPSITAADNITNETQPATVTLSGNTAAPTAVTINGTAATGITDQGAGVYSYTPPLIADDATATLEVTVDGQTLTTAISYANSCPFTLVTHGTPHPNSPFFGTQFATSGPVEWGVVMDYDPAIVIVNHAAMDAAEDELNDVALHSTEVAAGTTTATYKYFVPETGETGTFQASITVEAADTTAPTVTSVTVPTAGTYASGDNLNFTVNLDEAVTVTTTGGTPSLPVTVGATVRQAGYVSGSGSQALLFRYTVQAGDEDTDGISVGASISLNGGTIQDAAGNNLVLTLNGVGDASGVLVDGVAPVITINPLTATNTTPIVSGGAGDATSLTLVVTGVGTYNPVPSGGSWSQQLPTLALGEYPMTLNGEDAAGNVAVEAAGTLSVVAELPAAVFAQVGPVIEPVISNCIEDSIG